ncbi:MAG TPA: hydrogenase maturation nickel metallochaperone HypA [Polyangiaceae bacterium]|nr:hydrogenase maturation nickel metallochaperone HypA [Polyangiaceae bacterium]
MHELGLAVEIVEIVTRRAAGARIRRVVVEVGVLTAVLPDALSFCFSLASDGTEAAEAALEILRPSARVRCHACGADSEQTSVFACCPCGATDLEWLSGSEFKISAMEVI